MKVISVKIGKRIVGPGQPVFIIAEAGVNHNGSLALAKKLVDVAVAAKADAVKFQTFTPELVVNKTAGQAKYQKKNTGLVESQLDMIRRFELSRADHRELVAYCRKKGIIFLSTPFSEFDADFLSELKVPAFKTPSGEITNLPYLEHIAKKNKPMIVSTGMADMNETKQGLKTIMSTGNKNIVVLHCTSSYPPRAKDLNLNVITTFVKEFSAQGIPVGYSDNGSEGYVAEVIACSLGACVIEKHFTVDKTLPGPDQKASLSPQELQDMVKAIRETEIMLGSFEKKCTPEEVEIKRVARRSVVAKRDIPSGVRITRDDLIMKRPGTGISPAELRKVVGKKARRPIAADELITFVNLT